MARKTWRIYLSHSLRDSRPSVLCSLPLSLSLPPCLQKAVEGLYFDVGSRHTEDPGPELSSADVSQGLPRAPTGWQRISPPSSSGVWTSTSRSTTMACPQVPKPSESRTRFIALSPGLWPRVSADEFHQRFAGKPLVSPWKCPAVMRRLI